MKEYIVPRHESLKGFDCSRPIQISLVANSEKARKFVFNHAKRLKHFTGILLFHSSVDEKELLIVICSTQSYEGPYYITSFFTTPFVIAEYYGYKMEDFGLDTPGPILADALEERANERLWPITSEFTDLLEILRTDYSHLPINKSDFAL